MPLSLLAQKNSRPRLKAGTTAMDNSEIRPPFFQGQRGGHSARLTVRDVEHHPCEEHDRLEPWHGDHFLSVERECSISGSGLKDVADGLASGCAGDKDTDELNEDGNRWHGDHLLFLSIGELRWFYCSRLPRKRRAPKSFTYIPSARCYQQESHGAISKKQTGIPCGSLCLFIRTFSREREHHESPVSDQII